MRIFLIKIGFGKKKHFTTIIVSYPKIDGKIKMSIHLSLNIKPPKMGVRKKITFMPDVQKVFIKKK